MGAERRNTLDTYSHVLPGLQAAAAARLDTMLEPLPEERVSDGA